MYCYFCKRNIDDINFRDIENLQRYISKSGKIKPKKKTGACSKHQRQITMAIKRARIMGLLPFVVK
ncbi:MAG: 30S ribosomal protein S18 [Candidatus Paceibacterota bacterium]|jgi:small subunit ribosomal protein S18